MTYLEYSINVHREASGFTARTKMFNGLKDIACLHKSKTALGLSRQGFSFALEFEKGIAQTELFKQK